MAVHSTRERPTSPRRNLSTAVGLSSGLAWVCRRAGGANGDAKLAPKLVLQGLDFGPKTLTCDQCSYPNRMDNFWNLRSPHTRCLVA